MYTSYLNWSTAPPPPPGGPMIALLDWGHKVDEDHNNFPFKWHLAEPKWWEDLDVTRFHPTVAP